MNNTVPHAVFASIEIDANDCIDAFEKIEVHEQQILRFFSSRSASSLNAIKLEQLAAFQTDPRFDRLARTKILEDGLSDAPSVVRDFITCHVDELDMFGGVRPDLQDFVNQMQLVHIGFYPSDDLVNFDYSIDPNLSDELLVMRFNLAGQLTRIDWES